MSQSPRLQVQPVLRQFVEDEVLLGLSVCPDRFWAALEAILDDFAPRNAALL